MVQFKSLIIPSDFPTYKPANSFLDLVILDARLNLINSPERKTKTLPYDSDHSAISLEISLNDDEFQSQNPDEIQPRFIFKATNWKKFRRNLEETYQELPPDNRNLSVDEIDSAILNINSSITTAILNVVPRIKACNNTHKYVNSTIKKLHKIKSSLISSIHTLSTLDPRNIHPISLFAKNLLKLTKKRLKAQFKKATENYWTNQLKQVDHRKPESFFPKINRLLRPNDPIKIDSINIPVHNLPLLNRTNINLANATILNNEYVFTEQSDKLNAIGVFYESINSPRHLNQGTRLREIVTSTANRLLGELNACRLNNKTITTFTNLNKATNPIGVREQDNIFCNSASVNKILKHLPNKTSAALDNIPSITLKHLPLKMSTALTTIFNNALNNYYFPTCWKRAKVLPLLKKNKNPTEPSSYRPISLTPNLSKVFEIVINKNIVSFCDSNNIIPHTQFGFKQKHSTTHAIHKLLADLNSKVENSQFVGAALLDLEKAFDSVWLDGLLFKLHAKNFPKPLIFNIWEMINNKSFVTWDGNNVSSEIFHIQEGLQQGTVNSPILFNIFTSDILSLFGINNSETSAIAFADDVIIYTTSDSIETVRNTLETITEKINKWYINWNLRLSPTKCETILFRKPLNQIWTVNRAGYKNFQIALTTPGTNTITAVPHKNTVKYLGVHIDNLLRGNSHLETQLNKAKKAYQSNIRIFYNKHLSPRTKIILYLLLIRPIITYAAPTWWNVNHTMMEKMRIFERQCLRKCLHIYRSIHSNFLHYISNKSLYKLAQIPRIDNYILKLTRNYFSSISQTNNPNLIAISTPNTARAIRSMATGYVAPQTFIYCDKIGLLQTSSNIPLIYH